MCVRLPEGRTLALLPAGTASLMRSVIPCTYWALKPLWSAVDCERRTMQPVGIHPEAIRGSDYAQWTQHQAGGWNIAVGGALVPMSGGL